MFDPTGLAEDVTVEAVQQALHGELYSKALLLSLRLKEEGLLKHVLLCTPRKQVCTRPSICGCIAAGLELDVYLLSVQVAWVAASMPASAISQLFTVLADLLGANAHLEFVLIWLQAVCTHHSQSLCAAGGSARAHVLPALRGVHKGLCRMHEDLGAACQANIYTLQYLLTSVQSG